MNDTEVRPLTSWQQAALASLRMLIGWHFLYEGYYKLILPGWSADGRPLARWTSAGYLTAASGPFAGLFHRLADVGWIAWIDWMIVIGLLLVGLSLLLGLFTQTGCWGALALLSIFYLSSIPLSGTAQQGSEGAYLLVNKNLIELAAVLVIIFFRTGRIAGLDLLWQHRQRKTVDAVQAIAAASGSPVGLQDCHHRQN